MIMGPDIGSNTQNLYFTMSFYILKQKKYYKSFANTDFMNTFASANEKFSLGM